MMKSEVFFTHWSPNILPFILKPHLKSTFAAIRIPTATRGLGHLEIKRSCFEEFAMLLENSLRLKQQIGSGAVWDVTFTQDAAYCDTVI